MLEMRDIRVTFRAGSDTVKAVDGIDLSIARKEVVGLVGESGCGKTVTASAILRLLPPNSTVTGSILWQGRDILALPKRELRSVRGAQISMIFQNPVSSLNPVFPIGRQVVDVLRLHRNLTVHEASGEAVKLLEQVKIPGARNRMNDYPHQFSGGMCQRIMIAMAIAARPQLLIADEPTASLDVTIQAQIISLLRELKEELGMSILMISHDMGLIATICDRLSVMYLGSIVESGSTSEVFSHPAHPYTEALLKSILVPDPTRRETIGVLKGDIPSPVNLPEGCRFASRCNYHRANCETIAPHLTRVLGEHAVACHYPVASAVRA